MADPQTLNLGLYIPARGSDAGVWDLPENANDSATDSLFANVAVISLSNAPVTLTTPPNSGAAWSGPYQSQSAILKFTGALTADVTVTIPRPGFYIVWNLCTSGVSGIVPAGGVSGAFKIILSTGAGGSPKVIGVPPGNPVHVFSDGTDMTFCNLERPGTRVDMMGITAMPSWITACTVQPYVLRDGTIYNNTQFPTLAGTLGNTFGGTPGLSFAVPDSRARNDIAFDPGGATGRLTGTINGGTMGSAGGSQTIARAGLPNVTLNIPAGQGSHIHTFGGGGSIPQIGGGAGGTGQFFSGSGTVQAQSAGGATLNATLPGMITESINGGVAQAQGLPPGIVSFLPLIKT